MSENVKKRYKIEIDGETYTIAGPGSAEHVKIAEQLVNEQIEYLKEVNPKLSALQRANLVAFNAVADQIEKQKEVERLHEQDQ
jgi:Uncharacterized protein conserved in bacteria